LKKRHSPVGYRELEAIDRQLAMASFPSLSSFWRRTLQRFLASSKRTLVLRVGRRGGKSLSACKVAVAFAALGRWTVAPGELAVIAIVSVSVAEAQTKIGIIRAMLDALRVRVARETQGEIQLADVPVVFRCLAANARTVVGFGAALVIVDEAARLRDEATGANPCKEIVASLRPSLATHPGSRLLLISSPLGLGDYHAEQFARGETADQMVASAASWEANPTLTEAATRELEPDPRIWAREYAAIPQSSALGAFEVGDLERAFEARGDISKRFRVAMSTDASSGARDLFGYCVGGWAEIATGRLLVVDEIGSFAPALIRREGMEMVIAHLVGKAKACGASRVFGDQREALLLKMSFRRAGLSFHELTWTSSSKPRGIARLRRLLLEGSIALPRHTQLRKEMLSLEERIDSSGQISFSGAHTGDHLATLITLMLADEERLLVGSPLTVTTAAGGGTAWANAAPSAARAAFAGNGFGLAPRDPDPDPMTRVAINAQGHAVLDSAPPASYVFSHSRSGSGGGGF
jgi:hypothetical protein